MSLNPYRAKQVQEVIFSRKTNKSTHPSLYINSATVKLMHSQKHRDLQLNKLSFNGHNKNKISKTMKGIGLLRKLKTILPWRRLLIVYKSLLISIMEMLFLTKHSMHHFQIKLNKCNVTRHKQQQEPLRFLL